MNPWLAFALGVATGLALLAPLVVIWFRAAVSTPEQAVSSLALLLRAFASKAPSDLGIAIELDGCRGLLRLTSIADAIESSCLHSCSTLLDPATTGRVFRDVATPPPSPSE